MIIPWSMYADYFGATKDRETKDKELIEQMNELAKDGEFGEKIVELEHKITELEEEKGNLQLKIFDYEEKNGGNDHYACIN